MQLDVTQTFLRYLADPGWSLVGSGRHDLRSMVWLQNCMRLSPDLIQGLAAELHEIIS